MQKDYNNRNDRMINQVQHNPIDHGTAVVTRRFLLIKHIRVWLILAKLHLIDKIINSRIGAIFFILGKLLRLGLQALFMFLVLQKVNNIAGYNIDEMLFLLFTLNLVSTMTQALFRNVYIFKDHIITGFFDKYMSSPLDELFYSLLTYFDVFDLITLIPSIAFLYWSWVRVGIPINIKTLSIFFTFIIIAMIVCATWYIMVLSFGLRFYEVDNIIMIFRDLEKMTRYPIKIYGKYIEFILTYIVPVAFMSYIPTSVLTGKMDIYPILPLSVVTSITSLYISIKIWKLSLRHYSSASS